MGRDDSGLKIREEGFLAALETGDWVWWWKGIRSYAYDGMRFVREGLDGCSSFATTKPNKVQVSLGTNFSSVQRSELLQTSLFYDSTPSHSLHSLQVSQYPHNTLLACVELYNSLNSSPIHAAPY